MRRLFIALALVVSACAPKVVPPPVVTTPRFPEFQRPVVPADNTNTAAAINQSRGWAFLQNGDLKTAEHEFTAALKNDPRFFPAEASLGYLALARRDAKAALPHFDRVLEQQGQDLSALVGRGQALLALDREADALTAFESALAVDPNLGDVRRRVEVLKFRVLEQEIADARQAARAGRLDDAVRLYTAALAGQPDSAFLYRELADIERQRGQVDAALEHLRRAVALDPGDAHSLVQIGEILESRNDFEGAIQAYTDAAAIEPDDEIDRRIDDARSRAALARLPAEYRAIDELPQITRGDLAALIGIRLPSLLHGPSRPDAGLITDARNHWAATWIVAVARAGIMEPFANHVFQPRALVRRFELAQVAARLLAQVAAVRPAAAHDWESARLRFSDLAPSHLAYPAASAVVAAGVMQTGPDNAFQPSRVVTGAEAVAVVSRLQALAGQQ